MAADSDDDESDQSVGGESFMEPDEEEISPEDEAALRAFMNPQAESYQQQTLGDIILAKIQEKQKQSLSESIVGCAQYYKCGILQCLCGAKAQSVLCSAAA